MHQVTDMNVARAPGPEGARAGLVLLPGNDYLVEVAFFGSLGETSSEKLATLEEGLRMIGFTAAVIDQTNDKSTAKEWTLLDSATEPHERYRFIGRTDKAVTLFNREHVVWLCAVPTPIDIMGNFGRRVRLHRVLAGKRYHLRFFSWVKTATGREAVRLELEKLGFHVDKLLALKKNMRLNDMPGVTHTFWYMSGTWSGPEGYLTAQEIFFFEDVVNEDGGDVGIEPAEANEIEVEGELEAAVREPEAEQVIEAEAHDGGPAESGTLPLVVSNFPEEKPVDNTMATVDKVIFLTPIGVSCRVHKTFAEPDEPCWACEHTAQEHAERIASPE